MTIGESISRAVSNSSNWNDSALDMVSFFPYDKFQTEDVRNWAYGAGLPQPKSHRSWGSVILNAQKLGMIKHVGYEKVSNRLAHRTPASVWVKT